MLKTEGYNEDLHYTYSYKLNSGVINHTNYDRLRRNSTNNYNNWQGFKSSFLPSKHSNFFTEQRPAINNRNHEKTGNERRINSSYVNRFGFSMPEILESDNVSSQTRKSYLNERFYKRKDIYVEPPWRTARPSNYYSYFGDRPYYMNKTIHSSSTSKIPFVQNNRNQQKNDKRSDLTLSQILDTGFQTGENSIDLTNRLRIYELLYSNNSSINDEARQLAGLQIYSFLTRNITNVLAKMIIIIPLIYLCLIN